MATDFISFGLTFIALTDVNNGREALTKAIRTYPIYMFKPKVAISLFLSLLPIGVLKKILTIFGKFSNNGHIY